MKFLNSLKIINLTNFQINSFFVKFLPLFFLPIFPFYANVFQLNEFIGFTREYYFLIFICSIAITFKIIQLYKKINFKKILLLFILLISYISIELFHVFLGGKFSIHGLLDIRLLIYSSLIGGLIFFFMYSYYLSILEPDSFCKHFETYINLLSFFLITFFVIWLCFYFKVFEPIYKFQILKSNSFSYMSLFLIYSILFLKKDKCSFYFNEKLLLTMSVMIIFMNDTRGAIIGLMIISFLYIYLFHKSKVKYLLPLIIFISYFIIGYYFNELIIINNKFKAFYAEILTAHSNNNLVVDLPPSMDLNENHLSLISRFFSNIYSFVLISQNFLFGIGQFDAYSLKVFGYGVHSFYILLVLSHGFVGFIIFLLILYFLLDKKINFSFPAICMYFIFFIIILNLINSIPLYFAPLLFSINNIELQR